MQPGFDRDRLLAECVLGLGLRLSVRRGLRISTRLGFRRSITEDHQPEAKLLFHVRIELAENPTDSLHQGLNFFHCPYTLRPDILLAKQNGHRSGATRPDQWPEKDGSGCGATTEGAHPCADKSLLKDSVVQQQHPPPQLGIRVVTTRHVSVSPIV